MQRLDRRLNALEVRRVSKLRDPTELSNAELATELLQSIDARGDVVAQTEVIALLIKLRSADPSVALLDEVASLAGRLLSLNVTEEGERDGDPA